MIEKILPIMLCIDIQMIFCTKEMPYFAIEYLTSIKKKFQAFNEYSADYLITGCIFEKWHLKNGVSDCKFRGMGQNFQILVQKNKVDFIQTFIIYVNFIFKVDCLKV